ncbi:MAG: hypothetical protein WDO17_22340 [Alphaproteobacteria bacterium]
MSAAAAADVPKLDVERTCRESAKADPTTNFDAKRCLDSEYRTRDELAGKWKDFPAADKQQCTQLATLGGTASYVALITCLEMNRDARQERAAGGSPQPSGMRKK